MCSLYRPLRATASADPPPVAVADRPPLDEPCDASPPVRRDPRADPPRTRPYGDPRSRVRIASARIACAILALSVAACRPHDAPRVRDDAAVAVAAAPPIDAPPPPADAAPAPGPTPTQLAAAGDSTCAVMSDHTVRCWGANAHGQLGNGETTDATSPVAPDIRAVIDLQLADATACALLDDASVACWGRISWHGRGEDLLRPTGVLGVIGVKRIFVLAGRACARVADDSLVCWGNVDARGHFAAGNAHRVPTPVVGLDHVAGMIADAAFSDDGRMWRWGNDGVPHRIDATGVQQVASRDGEVCGLLDAGRVLCVDGGRCGFPPPPPAPPASPPVKPAPARPGAKPTGHSAAGKPSTPAASKTAASKTAASKTAASKTTASKTTASKTGAKNATPTSAHSSGSGPPAGEPAQSPGFAPARQLAFDLGFCVVTTAGRLQCGDGCRKLDPVVLERVDTTVARCALLKSGTITCFDGAKFATVPGLQRATALAVGRAHACAIAEGTIRCWGDHQHGQLGDFALTP